MATMAPRDWYASMMAILCLGVTLAKTETPAILSTSCLWLSRSISLPVRQPWLPGCILIPSSAATLNAVGSASPVIMTTWTPPACN